MALTETLCSNSGAVSSGQRNEFRHLLVGGAVGEGLPGSAVETALDAT
jgi:hypothetical protein